MNVARNEAKIKFTADTSGFTAEIKKAETQLSTLRAKLRENGSEMKANGQSEDALKQKLSLLGQEMQAAQAKTAAMAEKLRAAQSIFGADSQEAAKLERQLSACRNVENNIQASINSTNEALARQKAANSQAGSAFGQLSAKIASQEHTLSALMGEYRNAVTEFGAASSQAEQVKGKINSLNAELSQDRAKMAEVEQAASGLETSLQGVGSGASSASGDLGSISDAVDASALMDAGEALGTVSEKLKEIGTSSVAAYAGLAGAASKVSAYFGETGTQAQKTSETIKNVFEGGFGDSTESVGNAILLVKQNLGDLNQADLTKVTQQALTLEDAYGIDMSESLRGANSLMTQFGMSATEAMDYLATGTQNGLDKTNELGDNISEYSGKFSEAGYSASDYFQLLQNGLAGGAYNLDKVNDSINEVTTRLGDGTIGDSIGQYSTKTQELFKAWQNGDASQKDVIDSIVGDIKNATSEQEKMNLASTAFGTLAEDGGTKMIESLTSVGNSYDDVSGKAVTLADNAQTPMQSLEASGRKLKDALAPVGEQLVSIASVGMAGLASVVTTVSDGFSKLPSPIKTVITSLGVAVTVVATALPVIMTLKGVFLAIKAVGLGASIAAMAGPIGIAVVAITAVVAAGTLLYKNWDKIKAMASSLASNLKRIWNGIKTSIVSIATAIGNSVKTKFTNLKARVTAIFNALKTVASVAWVAIKAKIITPVSSVVGAVKSKFSGMKSTVSSIFNSIKSVASSRFAAVKSAITGPISSAVSTVSSKVSAIKGFFSGLHLRIPTPSLPKLPHFTLKTGSKTVLGKTITYPTGFGVSWYAKAMNSPVILDSPTIFGAAGGKLLGGGESGKEVVSGADTLMDMIARTVEAATPTIDVDRLAERIATACASQSIVVRLDKREVGRFVKGVK